MHSSRRTLEGAAATVLPCERRRRRASIPGGVRVAAAADAGIVLGGRPVPPMEMVLRWSAGICSRTGAVEETGVAAGVLGHPARGVAWLANKLAPFDVTLRAGEVVLAGSFTRPVPARAGDTFHIDYGALGTIGVRFV